MFVVVYHSQCFVLRIFLPNLIQSILAADQKFHTRVIIEQTPPNGDKRVVIITLSQENNRLCNLFLLSLKMPQNKPTRPGQKNQQRRFIYQIPISCLPEKFILNHYGSSANLS